MLMLCVLGLGSARPTERAVKARVARAGLFCDTPGWRARKFRAGCAQPLADSRLERVSVADLAGLPGPGIAAVPLLAQAREGAGGVATLGVGEGCARPGVLCALVHVFTQGAGRFGVAGRARTVGLRSAGARRGRYLGPPRRQVLAWLTLRLPDIRLEFARSARLAPIGPCPASISSVAAAGTGVCAPRRCLSIDVARIARILPERREGVSPTLHTHPRPHPAAERVFDREPGYAPAARCRGAPRGGPSIAIACKARRARLAVEVFRAGCARRV